MTNNTFEEIWHVIESANNPFTVLHYGMDGDSIGSCFALKKVLEKMGKKISIYSIEQVPEYLTNLLAPEISCQETRIVDESFTFEGHDLLVGLDLSEEFRFSQSNGYRFPVNLKKINIDHHVTNNLWGDWNYIPTDKIAPSTATIPYKLFVSQNCQIDKTAAKALLIGILSDTGNLSFQDVTSEDLRIAADLMDLGANKYEIFWKTTFNQDPDIFKFKAIIYQNMVIKEKYAYSWIDNKAKKEAGIPIDKKFGPITDTFKTIAGVDFVFAVSESKEGGASHAGFRSTHEKFDTTKIAVPLGGGGHKPASGAPLEGVKSVLEGIKKVEETISKELNNFAEKA